MKVISVVNYKGGVGKTTLLANLAISIANKKKSVLILDLDPQGSMTFSFIKPEEWEEKYKDNLTIKNWFEDRLDSKDRNLKELIIDDLRVNKNLDSKIGVISSHLGLFDVNMELVKKSCVKTLKMYAFEKTEQKNKLEMLTILKNGLKDLEELYDVVLIDCQPSFDYITQNAILASDYYLIPTKFDYLGNIGVISLNAHIENLIKDLNKNIKKYNLERNIFKPKLLGVVGNMITIAKGSTMVKFNENAVEELKKQGIKTFESKLRYNAEFMDMKQQIPAIMKMPSSNTQKNIIKELNAICDEFMKGIGI